MLDSLGNAVTLQSKDSVGALHDFVDGFLACEASAVNILSIAQTDTSPLVQAYCAALHMFAESNAAASNAQPFIERALAASLKTPNITTRESRFVAAVAAWVAGDVPRAMALHAEQAREHPRDLVSVKLGQYHAFNRGDAIGMLQLALDALPASADVPYMHGMAAFGYEQCHLLAQAQSAALRGIQLRRKEPWAHHALAHVMLTQGRFEEGQAFMRDVADTWTGLNSFMLTHNQWHCALFALELGHHDNLLRLYDQQIWGVAKDYSQDQIGAVSLLARLELAGVDVGARWHDLAPYLAARVNDHVLPFLNLHYAYGLARANRPEADLLVKNMQAFAQAKLLDEATSAYARHVWIDVCLPACRGLIAHAQGQYRAAAGMLGPILPHLISVGGSHAQRDMVDQIYLDALMRSNQWRLAQQIIQPRLNSAGTSRRLQRQASRVYAALGVAVAAPSLD